MKVKKECVSFLFGFGFHFVFGPFIHIVTLNETQFVVLVKCLHGLLLLLILRQGRGKIVRHRAFLQIELPAYVVFELVYTPKLICNLVNIKQPFIECVCSL